MQRHISVAIVVLILLICAGLFVGMTKRLREAAALIQCQNNLKQICLAIRNYEDSYRRFPNATITRGHMGEVPLRKRMSWLFDTLGFMGSLMDSEYGREYHKAGDRPWDAPENGLYLKWHYPLYVCPTHPDQGMTDGPALTHYVGITGMGKDAADLPKGDAKAGIFSWERSTTIDDITDGLANTMMVIETMRDNGPWVAPGRPTTRGLDPDEPPYLGEAAQFGSGHRTHQGFDFLTSTITNVGFADGSVRSLSSSISPQVFEALATMAGGERVDPADF